MNEVSSRIITGHVEFALSKGIPAEELFEGLGISEDQIQNPRARVSWTTYVQVESRLRDLYGSGFDQDFMDFSFDLKRLAPWISQFASLVRMFSSAAQIYWLASYVAGKANFSNIDSQFEELPDGCIRMTLVLDSDYPVFLPHFEMIRLAFERFPRLIRLPDAIVDLEISGNQAEYLIRTPKSKTLWSKLVLISRLVFSTKSVLGVLSEQEQTLRSQYDRLYEIQRELRRSNELLDQRVRERTRELEEANRSLRESESKLRSILDSIPEMVFLLDREGKIQAINHVVVQYGLAPEDLIGRRYSDFMPEHVLANYDQVVKAAFETGEIQQIDFWMDTRSEGVKWFSVNLSPIRGTDGEITGLGGSSFDISRRKESERLVSEAMASSNAANREKNMNLAQMVQSLGDPLAVILGFSSLIGADRIAESEIQEYVNWIHDSGRVIHTRMNELVEIFRADTGSLASSVRHERAVGPIVKDIAPIRLDGRKILLVESQSEVVRLHSLLFEHAGAAVSVASKSEDAVRTDDEDHQDVILIDMQLTDMEGYRAATALRARGRTVPIIGMISFDFGDERRKCLASGCDEVQLKTAPLGTLLSVVSFLTARD